MKKLYKITALLLAMIIAMSSLAGCSFTNQKEQTRTIVDISGAEVEIPAEVDEVVNLFSFGSSSFKSASYTNDLDIKYLQLSSVSNLSIYSAFISSLFSSPF